MKNPHNHNIDSDASSLYLLVRYPRTRGPEEERCPGNRIRGAHPETIREGEHRRDDELHGSIHHRLQGLNPLSCHQKRSQSGVSQVVEHFWV